MAVQDPARVSAQVHGQDHKTVWRLRLGVGIVGFVLPIALIAFNWIAGDKTIVPTSMSGSYYTSARNVFVGAVCALGVFLIFYRHTKAQDRSTWFAGLFAVLVALAPTAPAPPKTEPLWINVLHHGAAGLLIFMLGLFCWFVFARESRPGQAQPASQEGQAQPASQGGGFSSWVASAWGDLRRDAWGRFYFGCGLVVFVSGLLALVTGVWPTSWSTGWPSLYLFEAIAVAAFGLAWIVAGWQMRTASTQGQLAPIA